MIFSKVNADAFSEPLNDFDSGYACLLMMAKYYDKNFAEETFRKKVNCNNENNSLTEISRAAEKIGFRARCVSLTFNQLMNDAPLPCILQWDQYHYAILLPRNRWRLVKQISCAHPNKGIVTYARDTFLQHWATDTQKDSEITSGVLILEPTLRFRNKPHKEKNVLNWRVMTQFFRRSRRQVIQLIMALLITSFFQLIVPFLMQSIVDVGINTQDLHYITIVLIAQLMLVISRLSVDLIRARLLLHISTTVNLAILSDFWIKLTHLPITFFDRQHTGDILQRMNDNRKVQDFITGPVLNTIFSILNFIVFAIVLMTYKLQLFFIFVTGITLYFAWMRIFLSIRRKINNQLFKTFAKENNTTLQLVQGMQEIRLHNVEQTKRWEWESRQVEIFRVNYKKMNYAQMQRTGALIINQGKDMVLTLAVAKLMIEGQLTFGAMLAVQYIIGQLSSPVEQLIGFIQNAQDARMSIDRLNEVHQLEDEEKQEKNYVQQLPGEKTLYLNNLSFRYPGDKAKPVLYNIHLQIPVGKTTAIVGESGSGKTTLIKLLLKFYDQYEGSIKIGDIDFKEVSHSFWRTQCAAILPDSFIFNDTIAKNISLGYEQPDWDRLKEACRIANILSFIESQPDGFNTTLGADGTGISQGQKQRILIARAVYRNPAFLFLDESTNSLDENNEKAVVKNLQLFSENRTVVVIAHRLSTVKKADNIVVLHQGHIVEQGTHQQLSEKRGRYFRLVKSQLELGVDE